MEVPHDGICNEDYLNNGISSCFNDIEWNSILQTTKDGYQNYYDESSGFTFSDEGLNGDRLFWLL